MKDRRAAFTLIELLIVIAMLMIMTGVVSKTWIGMEKMSDGLRRNYDFAMRSQRIVDQLRLDIQRSQNVSRSEQALLILDQQTTEGTPRKVVYRIENDELLREDGTREENRRTVKIGSVKNTFLEISFMQDNRVRVEVRRRSRQLPLDLETRRFVTFISGVKAAS
ncbi:MAG: type II secretion system protein [bacterium]